MLWMYVRVRQAGKGEAPPLASAALTRLQLGRQQQLCCHQGGDDVALGAPHISRQFMPVCKGTGGSSRHQG